jgi:hypothetical protein
MATKSVTLQVRLDAQSVELLDRVRHVMRQRVGGAEFPRSRVHRLALLKGLQSLYDELRIQEAERKQKVAGAFPQKVGELRDGC